MDAMAGNAQQSQLMEEAPASFADLKPLMICGTMRSGATLLWTLLDAHPLRAYSQPRYRIADVDGYTSLGKRTVNPST